MGFFGTGNHRVFSIQDREHHKPKAFGFFAVKTAHELATGMITDWLGDENCKKKLFAFIKQRPSVLQLQLIALMVAVHYVYAANMLRVPQDVLSEVRDGIADGINALMNNKATSDFSNMMQVSIANYVREIVQEIANPPAEPGTVSPHVDAPSVTFSVLIAKSYDPEAYDKIVQAPEFSLEEMFLHHLVADAWVSLMTRLQNGAQLKFVP
jgi:hypothetical protein